MGGVGRLERLLGPRRTGAHCGDSNPRGQLILLVLLLTTGESKFKNEYEAST